MISLLCFREGFGSTGASLSRRGAVDKSPKKPHDVLWKMTLRRIAYSRRRYGKMRPDQNPILIVKRFSHFAHLKINRSRQVVALGVALPPPLGEVSRSLYTESTRSAKGIRDNQGGVLSF